MCKFVQTYGLYITTNNCLISSVSIFLFDFVLSMFTYWMLTHEISRNKVFKKAVERQQDVPEERSVENHRGEGKS